MADYMEHNADGIPGGRRISRSHSPGPTRRALLPPRETPYVVPRGVKSRLTTASGEECGTMLYVSNLGYRVSEEDIRVLFSAIGELKSYAIHCDKSGRSKGTGEVVYFQKSDALMAIRKYNDIPLDGKPIKIEEVGKINFEVPAWPPMTGIALGNYPKGSSFECVPPRRYGADNSARENQGFSRHAGSYNRSKPQKSAGDEHNWREKSNIQKKRSLILLLS
ncbi:unnamed protein product [Cuscuta epithymum]|uniref:RRM domain-containing protein n=1 Tax=Cuscuta epithymum TaxID=186058 RepID=A0AAV0EBT5_9ASTE|nr:unnamed protein product [Cuscuta epithymum]